MFDAVYYLYYVTATTLRKHKWHCQSAKYNIYTRE